MAAPTINNQFVTVVGPRKIEYIDLTDDTSNDETVQTVIQNPTTVSIERVNADLTGTADTASATISGKTITLRDPAASGRYILTVIGF